ncbi:hypothetical protein QF037_010230 [Streptomyces canus]|uniref:hypothetical protein n=1 Tax=Streptomyces canus TaxID=58343 RepID=UPI002786A432|nr:hypothetical protein [Streptomyces canus]MDQ0605797.1 hypothetical protein [Streptomyces canus]
MRKLPSLAAIATLAGVAVIAPAPGASAAPSCHDNYRNAEAGYMYAYNDAYCEGLLGRAVGDDRDWGDSASSFQGSDDNRAGSILNKGEYSVVKFMQFPRSFDGFNPHICLTRSEGFASNLSDDYWMEDSSHHGSVNNDISAHLWVGLDSCSAFAK